MSATTTMAVCRKGHVASYQVVDPAGRQILETDLGPWNRGATGTRPLDPYCPECGASVLTACGCGRPIPIVDLAWGFGEPKPFCAGCGNPFPWATREQRIEGLRNLLDEDDLQPAERLQVEEAIELLARPEDDATATITARRGAADVIRRIAPKAWELGLPILTSTLGAELRRQLGLPY